MPPRARFNSQPASTIARRARELVPLICAHSAKSSTCTAASAPAGLKSSTERVRHALAPHIPDGP
eukprot:6190246-Pyramimonas_sp.AAC.1